MGITPLMGDKRFKVFNLNKPNSDNSLDNPTYLVGQTIVWLLVNPTSDNKSNKTNVLGYPSSFLKVFSQT